jgi:hypothetical protein
MGVWGLEVARRPPQTPIFFKKIKKINDKINFSFLIFFF